MEVIFQTFFWEDTQARGGSVIGAEKFFCPSAQGTSNATASIPSVRDLGKENKCARVKESDKASTVLVLANILYYTPRARSF